MNSLTPMGATLYRLYTNEQCTDHGLRVAVGKGMITPDEYKLITEKEYEPLPPEPSTPTEYPYGLDSTQLEDVEQKYRDKAVTEVSEDAQS